MLNQAYLICKNDDKNQALVCSIDEYFMKFIIFPKNVILYTYSYFNVSDLYSFRAHSAFPHNFLY